MPSNPWFDSNIFEIIGRTWADGGLPYVDAWDHKGPLIFFLNALSYRFTGGSEGIFIIQVLGWLTFCLFGYRMLLFRFESRTALALTLVAIIARCGMPTESNQVSDYIMPFTTIAFYLSCKWFFTSPPGRVQPHNPLYALFYGLTAGICLMMRTTDMRPVAGLSLSIAICLAAARLWRNLLANIASFILGAALMPLPFMLYFYQHGALGDMWFATFGYNCIYLRDGGFALTLPEIIRHFAYYYPAYLALALSLYSGLRHTAGRRFALLWILPSALLLMWYVSGMNFAHYAIASLPLLFIIFMELHDIRQERIAVRAAAGVLIVAIAGGVVNNLHNCVRMYAVDTSELAEEKLLKLIPPADYDSVLFVNSATSPMLEHNIPVVSRYFTLQTWYADHCDAIAVDFAVDVESKAPKWIIGDSRYIKDLVQKKYTQEAELNYMRLYRRINY